jgi:hypothetical protein
MTMLSMAAIGLACAMAIHLIVCPFQALVRTLYVSGIFAAADTLLKVIIIFGMHVPLFLYGCAYCLLDALTQCETRCLLGCQW